MCEAFFSSVNSASRLCYASQHTAVDSSQYVTAGCPEPNGPSLQTSVPGPESQRLIQELDKIQVGYAYRHIWGLQNLVIIWVGNNTIMPCQMFTGADLFPTTYHMYIKRNNAWIVEFQKELAYCWNLSYWNTYIFHSV